MNDSVSTQIEGVPLLQRDVAPTVAVDLVLRALEHVRREIHARHLTVDGVRVEGESGTHSDLEHAGSRLDLQRTDDRGNAWIEHATKNEIIEV